ncbi:uncharacterized protein LOC141528987 [Cotesia typhae]|uniref:uncharacterized protein LOC141528987 n=1 Tax=Cotesia typhae TaxID=2053667 RepID=UPI003D6977E6
MVRIIPVHNFLSQNVGQIEEPTASCTANLMDQDLLLLALSSHCVKVYGLASNQYKLLTIFPTVDLVQELVHSDKGNYVATLESKSSRDGATVNNFVRVYINWEMTGNQNQAMRARIAGRVTPSLNRTLNSLEMIELPLNGQPTKIACCQTTGNLLVVMEDEAVIHELKVETQQTSKHKFLDFEVRPWSIRFTFSPTHVEFAEEFISVMNSWYFMLIRLTNRFHDDNFISSDRIDKININNSKKKYSYPLKEASVINNNNNCSEESKLTTRVDFNKSIINEREYIDWDQLVLNESQETQRIKALGIVKEDNNLNICFPSVKSDLSQSHYFLDPPVIQATEITAVVTTRSYEDSWSENYIIEYLLRLKITEVAPVQDGNEYFTCSILKPSYKRQKTSISSFKKSLLRSTKYNIFNGVTCLVCTTQEGYLYNFLPNSSEEIFFDGNCQIYPFTAPVIHVALENTALHALTEAGLESYTLRIQYLKSKEPPLYDTPVSLIGLRPFLGVKKLLHASRCLVLLANDEDTWTFYSLNLPTAEDVYQDILTAANNHKTSPSTYKHLLAEANTVLKISKEMIYYTSDAAFFSSINDMSKSHLDNLYRQSCALLADFYMTSESPMDWGLSSWYYEVAGLKAHDVIARKDIQRAPGIVTFVSESLLNLQSGAEADTLFQEHNIVEILVKAEKSDLLKLILASPVLREYATDKLINVISNWEADDMTWLALVLLYTQAGRIHQAERALEPISDKFIAEKSLSNWSWLFDVVSAKKSNAMPTFSEFAGTLMRLKLRVFAQVLSKIIERGAVTLDQMIQIFLGYLPSRVGRDGRIAGNALQLCLETYLQSYYENFQCEKIDLAIVEAFKILVRSYLAELTQNGAKVCTNDTQVLFGSFRPRFLDNPLIYEKGKIKSKERTARISEEFNESFKESIRLEVVKLQALLASGSLPEECYQEIQHFLETQKIEGSLSFKILCVRDTGQEIQLLADECPQVLLDYAKDKYTQESDWKHFIQFLLKKIMDNQNNKNIYCIYDDLIRDTAIYIAQTMSMSGLKRILPNDSLHILQQYIDTSNQVVHADYIKTMIIGTGQHLLCNINF